MRRVFLQRIIPGIVLSLAFAIAGHAQDIKRMDQVVQELVDSKRFMGTVLIARGDQIIFDKAYGSANLEWNIPNTPTTKFRLGSVTKQFTAAGILLLEERGKLKVDDPIKTFTSAAPEAWSAITLRHLLTHTSGIPNVTDLPDFRKHRQSSASLDEQIGWFRDQPLEFVPGEKMAYSNSGYIMLGYVIEKISGMSYADFVQKNIFTPLGMKDSGYDSNPAIIERRASGYSRNGDHIVNADYLNMTIPFAAGGLYSTTEDLLLWQRGLYGNKVISADSLQRMTTPFRNDYGFGIIVDRKSKRTIFQHSGGIEGFNTHLAYYPDSRITAVALSNLNGDAPALIVARLGALAHDEKITLTSERSEVTLAPDLLKKYVGTYALGPNVNVMVTLEGNQLMTQVSGQRKTPAYAESDTRFFLKVVDAQWEFFSTSGEVTHLVLYQDGREMKASRTSSTVAQRREIPVPVAILQQYVGTYQLRPGFDIVIRVDGAQLTLQATGQGVDRLYAETDARFFSKVVDATIEFNRGAGTVTDLELTQGAFKGKASRQQ